ncbi:Mur ligase family protein [Thermomicrobiaceae bacterium CFH 74404]|uniref:Mur ligase family protein n=1 Tax=Thermalbibacter longus TaxID=2951981 RepID=A0AA42BDS9_9BACT|nr:Mur ligase family protein [Thermalbibacter longus]MCM8750048.1 Mur ligase family protein [Thermalbibacter longus]
MSASETDAVPSMARLYDAVGSPEPLADPVPVVAITGTRGKSTTSWLLHDILSDLGWPLGLWCSAGVFVNGRRQPGELQPWTEVLHALQGGELAIAIQELEAPVVASVGLPPQAYRLAAVTTICGNNEACLISPEAQHAARAQRIVARAVHPTGQLVLNADDLEVLGVAEETTAEVVLFALHPENPALRRHLSTGGRGVWLDDGVVVGGNADSAVPILRVQDIAFTLGGSLTFQVQNVLCATALALCLGVPHGIIQRAVRRFLPDPHLLPGACNLIDRRGATIILDTSHHPWTLRQLIRGIRQQPHRRTIIVSHGFEDLSPDQTVEVGKLLGRLGGVVIIHGVVADGHLDLLKAGLIRNVMPPLIVTQPDESTAIQHALQLLREGDLCLVITRTVDQAIETLRSGRA